MATINSIFIWAGSQHLAGRRSCARNVACLLHATSVSRKQGGPCLALEMLIPGLTVESVSDPECCGMGDNFGFKAEFHEKFLAVGNSLLAKIRKVDIQAIVTNCMNCRLQFGHVMPSPVFNPLEILAKTYRHSDHSAGERIGAR